MGLDLLDWLDPACGHAVWASHRRGPPQSRRRPPHTILKTNTLLHHRVLYIRKMAGEKKWIPLESNPDVLNEFISKLGIDAAKYSFSDVFGLDEVRPGEQAGLQCSKAN